MTASFFTAEVKIEGTKPILWHAFTPDALAGPGERKEKTGTAGNDPEEWKRTVLMTPERRLFLKPTYISACLIDGAKNTKLKRSATLKSTMASTLEIMDNIILLDRWVPEEPVPTEPENDVYLDIRGVKNPATKGRNVRYRIAASPGWHCEFTIRWNKTLFGSDVMKGVVNDSGQLCGLGDARSVGYGRFEVLSFEMV